MINYDQEYIKPETRGDWFVEEKLKKVWFVQLDLIKKLDVICKENGLRWFPIFGTLLGAVRHHGFIPWDDDVDVLMPREDFDKLKKICAENLEEPYFLQTTESDNECYMYIAALRNSDTTGNRSSCLRLNQNSGIPIDIFPLEGCENNLNLFRLRRFPMYVKSVLCNTYVNEINTTKKAVILRKLLRMFRLDYKKTYKKLEAINSRHPFDGSETCTITLQRDAGTKHLSQQVWKSEWFKETVMMPFEDMMVPVPIGYDKILTAFYGDYMKVPPLDKRVAKHDVIFEPDIPYKEYVKGIRENHT